MTSQPTGILSKNNSNGQQVEGVSQRNAQDLTTLTSPATFIGDTLQQSVQLSPSLLRGIRVTKISSLGKPRRRVLTISNDRLALFCTHAPVSRKEGIPFTKAKSLSTPFFSTTRFRECFGGGDEEESRDVQYIDVADLEFVHTALVGTIALEKSRTKQRLQGQDSPIDQNRHQIVTIGHHGTETLSVLVADDRQRQELVDCLLQMRDTYQRAKSRVANEELLLRYIWYDVDVNRDGRIASTEFSKIMNRINLYASNAGKRYQDYMVANGKSNDKAGLNLFECVQLLETLAKSPDHEHAVADGIWNECFGSHVDTVSAFEFLDKFLDRKQGENSVTLEQVKAVFNLVNSMELNRNESKESDAAKSMDKQINRKRFEAYLHGEMNEAYDPEKRRFRGPLDKPISQYWISSSHNTYISGNQLDSVSSVEMYMRALRRSCKCVELDCWDGETPKSGGRYIPIVYHGSTLTSKLTFADIIQGIKSYIDTDPTTYPIILSIESHCSPPFEDSMASSLRNILGKSLYFPSQEECEAAELPSPEKLRGMVIIKGKRPPEPDDEEGDGDECHKVTPASHHQHEKDPSNPLASLTLFHGTKFHSFDQSLQQPAYHMHSIGESKITKIIQKSTDNAVRWCEYNQHHMTRNYPSGARVDSSNYNPISAWAVGCQLVALNFQTSDTPLILNDGLFRQNGACGYVPKPDGILEFHKKSLSGDSPPPLELTIRVLSAICLPKSQGSKSGYAIDPFVKVTVHDVKPLEHHHKEHAVSQTQQTISVSDNGFRPVWKSDPMTFSIDCPDVAMIHFSVWERDLVALTDPLADSAIPFSCLRKGYRSIALYDSSSNTRTGPFGFATLLVEISY